MLERRFDGVLLSGWLNVCSEDKMVPGGFVCMMRTERDVLLVGSKAFSGSMMSERWDFRWEALGYKKDVVFREGNHVFVLRCCRIKSEHSKVSV